MNQSNARSVPVYGGFHGEYRLVHQASWRPVMNGGRARIFPTAADAEIAAWRELNAKRYPEIRSDGERASGARSKAETLFGSIFKHGKRILVTRK